MNRTRLILTGFMASGKTTLGRIVANSIGWLHKDLDKIIEAHFSKSISELFKELGEEKFREIESDFLVKELKDDFIVLSLGGGTITFSENFKKIKDAGYLVYLYSSPEKIYERLKFKVDRPMFQTIDSKPMEKNEAIKKITALLSAREKYYSQADLIFSTNEKNVGRSVDLLIKQIKPFLELKS